MSEYYNKNKRLKTNSITHLVKIVAEEVFEECMEKHSTPIHFIVINNRVNELQDKYEKLDKKLSTKPHVIEIDRLSMRIAELSKKMENVKITNLHIDTKEALKKLNNDLLKAGGLWTDDEDTLLERELNVAVNAMAANHQRSKGAIKSRLQKMM